MTEQLQIDLLFLDLETCARCRGADRSLESALATTRELLDATGVETKVRKVRIESAEQARAEHFESSPTIRVNGRDAALELHESECGSEACTDGSGDAIACRVWVWQGREYTEPPAAMIVDSILREVYGRAHTASTPIADPYRLPANLERFFAGETKPNDCCAAAEQRSCCEPEAKAECCGASSTGGCGCQ